MKLLNIVNMGLGNGLLPEGNMPLPKPMLTHRSDIEVLWNKSKVI